MIDYNLKETIQFVSQTSGSIKRQCQNSWENEQFSLYDKGKTVFFTLNLLYQQIRIGEN